MFVAQVFFFFSYLPAPFNSVESSKEERKKKGKQEETKLKLFLLGLRLLLYSCWGCCKLLSSLQRLLIFALLTHIYVRSFFFFFTAFHQLFAMSSLPPLFFFLLVYLLLLTPHLTMVLNKVPVNDDNNSDVLSVFAA